MQTNVKLIEAINNAFSVEAIKISKGLKFHKKELKDVDLYLLSKISGIFEITVKRSGTGLTVILIDFTKHGNYIHLASAQTKLFIEEYA